MKKLLVYAGAIALAACSSSQPNNEAAKQQFVQKTDSFLTSYNAEYQRLLVVSSEAEWALNTHIVEGDTTSAHAAQVANKAMADYTGSKLVSDFALELLKGDSLLNEVQKRQLHAIVYNAGANPEAAGDLITQRIKAETEQTEKLFGFNFMLNGKPVTPNQIDEVLRTSTNLKERRAAWEASKEVGVGLKDGLANLQQLRNGVVKPLGYSDYFAYQVSEYGMTSSEMNALCLQLVQDVWPLYRELHTWARYTLAAKYKQPVPDQIPADWLPNRWGQDWSALVQVEGFDLDASLHKKDAEWIVKEGEKFYQSMGYPALPASFYEKSSLYPLAADATYKKNNHASAWHMNNAEDVRSLMSVEPNAEWWETTLHELGHIYYYITYSNPETPIVLREGANRAYHEAIGTLIGLASMQKPFLMQYGLIDSAAKVDMTQVLLKEALNYVVVMPWAAGVMTGFENDLYTNNLLKEQYNAKWWELVVKYQGIVPPTVRDEKYCDAASKTHINDDPAQYYDYALSNVLLFQFHQYIAKNILKQDPHETNYYGSTATGDFLRKLTYPGANVDWRNQLQEVLGEGISGKAMLEYFAPLMDYLKEQNKGRICTLPESI